MTPTDPERPLIRTARDAANLLGPLLGGAREKIAVAHLDGSRRLIAIAAAEGAADEAELPIRSIVAEALRLGASGIVVAHNHPSGDPEPSEADKAATRRLADTAGRLDIAVHDHLVFGGDDCRSFRALGLL